MFIPIVIFDRGWIRIKYVRYRMKHFSTLAIIACFLCAIETASANPVSVDPAGTVRSYTFFLIAAGTIAVETAILCVINRVFHNSECDIGMKISVVALNILTLVVILMPLLRLTNSVLISELGVVVAETYAIQKIFGFNGVPVALGRALSYSVAVNLVSYTIGALCQ